MPAIGLGTYKLNGKAGERQIAHALEIGYRHLDTAQMYHNELEVGRALKQSSVSADAVFITTKIWPANYNRLVEATGESLKALSIPVLDLLLLHWPAEDMKDTLTGLNALNEVLHKGYAKAVGVSNFNTTWLLKALELAPVQYNQVEYHPFLNQQKLMSCMQAKHVSMIAYYPLAHGRVMNNDILKNIALQHKKTEAQVALRWLVQQGVCAIPKSADAKRQQENLQVFDFELSATEMNDIFSLTTNKHYVSLGGWVNWD